MNISVDNAPSTNISAKSEIRLSTVTPLNAREHRRHFDIPVIGITGTNGKTTTKELVSAVLTENGYDVLNNKAGSNIDAGIASSLLGDANLLGHVKKQLAVFEVDERSSLKIYAYIHPDYAVCTNLFRDSIGRNAHAEFISSIIERALPDDTHMILNADDPISSQLKPNNKRTYFSIARLDTDRTECVNIINDMRSCPKCGGKVEYEYVRYHHIGKMRCTSCGFASPEADYTASPDWTAGTFTWSCGSDGRGLPSGTGSVRY